MAHGELPAAALRVLQAGPGAETVVMAIGGPIRSADIPILCERARVVLQGSDADVVVCDVGALTNPDMTTIDALGRLALTARRLGHTVRLSNACAPLRDLLALVGLCETLGLDARSVLEPTHSAPCAYPSADDP